MDCDFQALFAQKWCTFEKDQNWQLFLALCGSGQPWDTHITRVWRQREELHFENTHRVLGPGFCSRLRSTVPARRKKTIRGQPLDWLPPNQIANSRRCRTNLWRGLSCVITPPPFNPPSSNQKPNLWWEMTKKVTSFKHSSIFFISFEGSHLGCSYLFDVAAISERLLCSVKMERPTSMITFMLWIENKKPKRTDNMFTSNSKPLTLLLLWLACLLWWQEEVLLFPWESLSVSRVTS